MKNKMEIREDPKFLMTNHQGVLTLNIRRPSPFDSGTYSCRAVNELGEALAECKLEVRGEPGGWGDGGGALCCTRLTLIHGRYKADGAGQTCALWEYDWEADSGPSRDIAMSGHRGSTGCWGWRGVG